jgi:hypothetical protein
VTQPKISAKGSYVEPWLYRACGTQTFGAACEIMPNICYQPPTRSEGVLRACSRSVVRVRGAAATVASRANEMTSQQHQRDNNEGQRGDSPQRPVRQQPDVWVEANNSPQGCAMQRLVGYQSKPEGSG